MIHRRCVLKTAAALSTWLLAGGHTPYRQRRVDRRKHLLIGASKVDPPAYELGKKIAALLEGALPESRTRVARAPHAWQLASLITTDQIDLILLLEDDVRALSGGKGGFEVFGETAFRSLFRFGGYWLVCRPDFPNDHTFLLTQTLAKHGTSLAKLQSPADERAPAPAHPGIGPL